MAPKERTRAPTLWLASREPILRSPFETVLFPQRRECAMIRQIGQWLQDFPFVRLGQVFVLARIATAVLFMAHAVMRIVNGSISQFGLFMESVGFPNGQVIVETITICELTAGSLLIANRLVRVAASALLAIVVTGIALIHWQFGWFVGEHGTGGSEYSVALVVLLLLVMANDRAERKEND